MQYRTLGHTGIKVSPYALGAMMLGAPAVGNPDHDDCIRIIHKALDAGINFVDTAGRYSNGESEAVVGKALKGRRDNVVLATKVNGPMGDDPNQRGNSRRWIMAEVENSLRRLQTDWIDLYQIHRPDPDTDIEETLSALTDLIRSSKVRAIGYSAMPASDIVEAQWVAERRGLERAGSGMCGTAGPDSTAAHGSRRVTLATRSIDRSSETISPIPVASACATRYASAKSNRSSSYTSSARINTDVPTVSIDGKAIAARISSATLARPTS
jgi:aryl-alcohol dehydrogenase-like predicted oxidoreductase